jgi:hypothetical protein
MKINSINVRNFLTSDVCQWRSLTTCPTGQKSIYVTAYGRCQRDMGKPAQYKLLGPDDMAYVFVFLGSIIIYRSTNEPFQAEHH